MISLNINEGNLKHVSLDQCHSRFTVISGEEFLQVAGNTIRISKLPSNENNHESGFRICKNDENVFATAEGRRGFSCIAYNACKGRVAYSARSTSPSIVLTSSSGCNRLCAIEGGVRVEYEDICFNRNGSKLAAIGRGKVDAKLLVWDLETSENSIVTPVLIASHMLEQPVSKCLFDPCDDKSIAILTSDNRAVIQCHLSQCVEGYKISNIRHHSPFQSINLRAIITAMSFETNSRLILGLDNGSILIIQGAGLSEPQHITNEALNNTPVRGIIVTSMHLIVAFGNGEVYWFQRQEFPNKLNLSKPMIQANAGCDISRLANSPDFDTVVALSSKGGKIYAWRVGVEMCGPDRQLRNGESFAKVAISQHTSGIVTSMACVTLTGKAGISVFVTASSDGSLRIWKDMECDRGRYEPQEMLGFVDVGIPITALEHLNGHPVIAVGFADSSVKFFYIEKGKSAKYAACASKSEHSEVDLTLIQSEVLGWSPITHLIFNDTSKKIAAGCSDGNIFILCTEPSNLHAIGVLETSNQETLESLFWSLSDPSHLFVGTTSSLLLFDIAPLCFTQDRLKPLHKRKVSSTPRGVMMHTGHSNSQLLFCCSPRTMIEFYDLRMTADDLALTLNSKHDNHQCFREVTVCLRIGHRIFVGTRLGEIIAVEFENKNAYITKHELISNSHCGAILDLCPSADRSRLYSSSTDSSIVEHTALDVSHDVTRSSYDYDYLKKQQSPTNISDRKYGTKRRLTWLHKSKDEMMQVLETKAEKSKQEILKRVNALSINAQHLIDRHSSPSNLNRFIIDVSADKQNRDDIESKLIRFREKMATQMSSKQTTLPTVSNCSIDSMTELTNDRCKLSVNSFQIKAMKNSQKRRMECIKVLRQNEIASRKHRSSEVSKIEEANDFKHIFEFNYEGHERERNKDECKRDNVVHTDACVDSSEWNKLLYPPHLIRSNIQRKLQIQLLEMSSREYMESFNSRFKVLKKERQDFEKILYASSTFISNISGKIGCDAKEFLEESSFGYTQGSKSTQLGYGTDKEKSLPSIPHTTTFINLKAELDHHEDYVGEEQKEEYVQFKIDQMKRIASNLDDISVDFNRKLRNLRKRRIHLRQALLRNDLNRFILAESIFMSDDCIHESALVRKTISHGQQQLLRSKTDLKIAQMENKRLDAIQQRIVSEDKIMEKHFRTRLQNLSGESLDQETVNLLHQLYRRRNFDSHESYTKQNGRRQNRRVLKSSVAKGPTLSRRSKLGRMSGRFNLDRSSTSNRKSHEFYDNSIAEKMELAKVEAERCQCDDDIVLVSDNDPFLNPDDESMCTDVTNSSKSLDCEEAPTMSDIPDGFLVKEDSWKIMLKLREEKVAKEQEIVIGARAFKQMNTILHNQEKEEQERQSAASALRQKLQWLKIVRHDNIEHTDFVVYICKEQDEIEKKGVLTDYSDALLLPSMVIDKANGSIQKLAQERIGILHKIKSSRRIINMMQFNHETLTLRNRDKKELLTDYHLLRLTSQLKKMLNGEVQRPEKIAIQTEMKFSRQKVAHDSKLEKLRREKEKVMKFLAKRKSESKKLEKQLGLLKKAVKAKESERKHDTTSCAIADKKMSKILKRAKIIQTMKSQRSKISRLHNELDILRQKTYPSFSKQLFN